MADSSFDMSMLHGAPQRSFARGEVIFIEGEPGATVHVIETGHVVIRVATEHGGVATVSVLGPREIFGEGALFSDDARRSATAIALEPVVTRWLDSEQFARIRDDPQVHDFLVRALTARLRVTTDHLLEALFVPVEIRVLRRLVTLADEFARGDNRVVLPVSQEDIAAMAGTTRPTANRVLRGAEDDGMVSLGRGRITIIDRVALARRAGAA